MSRREHSSNVIWLVDSSDDEDETAASISPRMPPAQVWAREEAVRLSDAAAVETMLQGAIACETTIDATLLELKKTIENVTVALEPPVTIQLPPTISEKDTHAANSYLVSPKKSLVKSSEEQSVAAKEIDATDSLAEASNSPVSPNKPWFVVEQTCVSSRRGRSGSTIQNTPSTPTVGGTEHSNDHTTTAGVVPTLPGGCHPLHYAALGGDLTLATRALEAAEVAAAEAVAIETSVTETITADVPTLTRVVPESGVSSGNNGVDPRADTGATPLHWAASAGHTAIVKLLLSHGANPVVRTKTGAGATPRDLASAKGHSEVVELLKDREAALSIEESANKVKTGNESEAVKEDAERGEENEADAGVETIITLPKKGADEEEAAASKQLAAISRPLVYDDVHDEAARISLERQRKLVDDDEWEESKEDRVDKKSVRLLLSQSVDTTNDNACAATAGMELENPPSVPPEFENTRMSQSVVPGDNALASPSTFAVATQLASTTVGADSNISDACDKSGASHGSIQNDGSVENSEPISLSDEVSNKVNVESSGKGKELKKAQTSKNALFEKRHPRHDLIGRGSKGPSAQVLSERRRRKTKHFLAATTTTAAVRAKKNQLQSNSSVHSITASCESSVKVPSIVSEFKGPSATELSRMRQSKSKALQNARYAGTIEDSTSVAAAAAASSATIAAATQLAARQVKTLVQSSSSSLSFSTSAVQPQSHPQVTQSLQDFLHPDNEGNERSSGRDQVEKEGNEHSIGIIPPARIVGVDVVGANAAHKLRNNSTATHHATIPATTGPLKETRASTAPEKAPKHNLTSTNARAAAAQRRANTNWIIATENERIKARLHAVYQGRGSQDHQHHQRNQNNSSSKHRRVPLVQQQAHPIFTPWTGYRTNAAASGLATAAARTAATSFTGDKGTDARSTLATCGVSAAEQGDHGPAANAVALLYGHDKGNTAARVAADKRSGKRHGCPPVPKGLGCVLCAACGQRSLLGGRRPGYTLRSTESDDNGRSNQGCADNEDSNGDDHDDIDDGGTYRPCPRCEVEWYCDDTCRVVDWNLQHRRKCLGVKHQTQSLPGAPSTAVNAHTPFWVVDERFALARRLLLSKPKPSPQAILSATEDLRRQIVTRNRKAKSKGAWADSLRADNDSREPGEVEVSAALDLLRGRSNAEWQAKFEAHLLHEADAKKIAPVIEDKYDSLLHSVRLSERHRLEAKLATAAELERASGAGFAAAADRHRTTTAAATATMTTGGGAGNGGAGNGSGPTLKSSAHPSTSSVGHEVQPSSSSSLPSEYRLDQMWARDLALRREKRVAWGDQSGLRSVFSDQGRELPHGGVGYTGGVRKDVSSAELPSHFFDGGVEGIKRTK